jgi:hypothetical protein
MHSYAAASWFDGFTWAACLCVELYALSAAREHMRCGWLVKYVCETFADALIISRGSMCGDAMETACQCLRLHCWCRQQHTCAVVGIACVVKIQLLVTVSCVRFNTGPVTGQWQVGN